MWIKDLQGGSIRKYGSDCHDALRISDDGRTLSYENMQNGDGSLYGDYRFVVDENGNVPRDDFELQKYGADAYANMGGFENSFEEQLSMIARHYGYKVQARQAIEEMAELTQAICKIQRYGFQDDYTDNLIEEIADVSIMVEQLKILVGSPSVTKKMKNKIARQIKRIFEEEEKT